ncbi:MAG: adenosylcobinamide-phosphate synthase CbiB [Cyanobacteria bacterium P01_H01_bin.15]
MANAHTSAIAILMSAAFLDFIIGDPWSWLHPVQVMGWVINKETAIFLKLAKSPLKRRIAGFFLGSSVILCSGAIAWSIQFLLGLTHPALGLLSQSILLASCFAGRSLRQAAEDVMKPLAAGNLTEARNRLALYVGRDTQDLSEPEIRRAILETVAENTVDGVTAPLFFAIIGAFVPGIGPAPFAIAYKAASTLDSSIGYMREPYIHIGWFSAQLEDYLTWIPCRLTVLCIACLSGKPRQAWKRCQRDGIKDPSPNSGWSECVFAAALGVQLGGINYYGGVAKPKPLLGDRDREIEFITIKQGLQLMRWAYLWGLSSGLVGLIIASHFI